jgi:Fungal Zn(2)-Cys(6) binuclear cluster domain
MGNFRSQSSETSVSHSPLSCSTDSVTDQGSDPVHSIQDKPPTRIKRSHSKVRTRCMTCRKRWVKCDEKKPGCDRCVKAGRVCEGYKDQNSKSHRTDIARHRATFFSPNQTYQTFRLSLTRMTWLALLLPFLRPPHREWQLVLSQ